MERKRLTGPRRKLDEREVNIHMKALKEYAHSERLRAGFRRGARAAFEGLQFEDHEDLDIALAEAEGWRWAFDIKTAEIRADIARLDGEARAS
jgi:hypothetical protein